MLKAGKTLLLLVALLAITGVTNKTEAFTSSNVTSCLNQLVSTPLCEDIERRVCNETFIPREEQKQIQAAVIIVEAKDKSSQTSGVVDPIALPTMAPLESTYAPNDATLDSDKIFDLVNQYRANQGLPPFEKDDKVCELAQIRSAELTHELSNGTVHSGLYNRNLPYWIFENAKVGSNEEGTVAWWLTSAVHHQSIVSYYKFSCVKCMGSVCSELFTSFSPK